MSDETTLLKIALITSIIGTLTLIIMSEKLQPQELKIIDINKSKLNQNVKTQGIITSIKQTKGLYILKIKDNTSEITVIIFKEQPLNLQKGINIEVQGLVTEYKNQIQIQASSIRTT